MTEFSFVQTRTFESVAVRYFRRNSHNADLIKTKKKALSCDRFKNAIW